MQEESNDQKIVEEYSRQINKLEGETSYWIGKSEQYRKLLKNVRGKYERMKRIAIIAISVEVVEIIVTICIFVWR